ncbi:MAG: class I adenylate-forming enzyme family protein [Solirubrobacterales bacterium]
MNISMLLDMAAAGFGDRLAVGPRAEARTYAELREEAQRVAARLRADAGVRLVLAGVNSADLPVLLFGSAYAGRRFSSVNYRLPDDRLRAALETCAPAIVVADESTAPRVEGVPGTELTDAAAIAAPLAAAAAADAGDEDEVAITLLTSGTSGVPKTVLLRHHNLVSYVIGTTELGAAGADEAALVSVPPYHIAGLASVLSNVYIGRRIVYLAQFDAARWVETAAAEGITHAMVVPTMLARILNAMEATGTDLPDLRLLSYGGGRMPLPVVRRALAQLPHVDFVNAYGLTETSSTIALLDPADHRAAIASDDEAVAARLGSVGRPLPGVEVEIRGADDAVLPAGKTGEIVVRGEQVSGEYEGRDVKDAAGWFRTNDNGRVDAEGYIFIEGRADDVIVRGGENLSPGEIEDTLLQHEEVLEAAVVAVADEEWGESPAAVVVVRPGAAVEAADLQAWVRERLRSSRTPTVVEFRASLPYSDTGKLLRRELRAELNA